MREARQRRGHRVEAVRAVGAREDRRQAWMAVRPARLAFATVNDATRGAGHLIGRNEIAGLAVWYEKSGFSARAAWNFHGKYIDAVGASAAGDDYYDNHTQLDLSFGQRLTRNFRLYTDPLNLTNAPLRYYEGTWDRPIQEEYYRWWPLFGVKANF